MEAGLKAEAVVAAPGATVNSISRITPSNSHR